MTTRTASLAALYTNAGLPCELEASQLGIWIYAASPAVVGAVARNLAATVKTRGGNATVSKVSFDKDERPGTAHFASVEFDWACFEA